MRRRGAWLVLVLAMAAGAANAQPAPGSLTPPVTPTCISSPFGWRHAVGPHAPEGMHNGVDLPAPAGAYVRAAAAGRVLAVKRMGMGGLQVILEHDDERAGEQASGHGGAKGGWRTLYAHLGTVVPALAEGKRSVAAGDPIGRIGRTGVTYGTHLFFEILVAGSPIDPEPILGAPRCHR